MDNTTNEQIKQMIRDKMKNDMLTLSEFAENSELSKLTFNAFMNGAIDYTCLRVCDLECIMKYCGTTLHLTIQ